MSRNSTKEHSSSKDKSRRLYKYAIETAKSLDEVSKRKTALRDPFSSEMVFYRNKLKDCCEKLMFLDPLEFGRKAEELIWRKVFYDAIQTTKQLKKNNKLPKNHTASYQSHLMAASGYYNHLLFKLQYEFQLDLKNVSDCFYQAYASSAEVDTGKSKHDEKAVSWAEKAAHRCLVYLGDLARYMKEEDGNRSWILAQRYYYQALHYIPENGMPHNQLGTLVGTRYYGLDAAYHYIRCLASSSKFQGASGNLRRVFEQNQKRYHDLMAVQSKNEHKELSHHQQRINDIKSFSIKFLHLMCTLYNLGDSSSDTSSVDPKELQTLCQSVIQEFQFALFHPKPDDTSSMKLGEEKMAYLEDEMVFKIVVLIMTVVHKLQSQGSKQVAAAIALNLAVFSHILNHTLTRLQTAFYEVGNPVSDTLEDASSNATDGPGSQQNTQFSDTEDDLDRKVRQKILEEERKTEDSDDEMETSKMNTGRRTSRAQRRRRRKVADDLSEGEDEVHQEEVLTMISDDEEELNFLTGGNMDTSSSEGEEENLAHLMVSQELRPGFLDSASTEQLEDDLSRLNLQASHRNFASSSGSMMLHNLLNSSALASNFVGNEADLQKLSSDLLSMSLRLPSLFSSEQIDSAVDAIAHGKKQVSVPPGFDQDPEAQHVAEISHKLSTYTIDTDTNSSIHTVSDQYDSTDTESIIDRVEQREKQIQHVLEVISDQGLVCVIKVLCDWLICQPHIINTCIKSSPVLWTRLSYFLNFLPLESMISKKDLYRSSELLSHVKELSPQNPTWKQKYPLREDINLYKLSVVNEAHLSIDFDKDLQYSSMEESLLRICCLRSFGYRMCELTGNSFSYNREKRMFVGPQTETSGHDPEAQVKMEDIDARRNQLMKDMAQLRLQAEVSQLKDSVSTISRNLPPYLVPDSSALLESLHLVKQLVQSSKFIVIIPLCVIDQLDYAKKDSGPARNAIRWLESEFRRGNRYMRAQKMYEKMPYNHSKGARRRYDKDQWKLMQIIDCCKRLGEQSPDCPPTGMVSMLTNVDYTIHNVPKVRQLAEQIQQQGLKIHNIVEFHSKWKEQWKKKG